MGQRLSRRHTQILGRKLRQLEADKQQLLTSLKAITDDPSGAIAPFLKQLESAISQNNRLSALAALVIQNNGGALTLPVVDLEVFVGKRITLQYTLQEVDGVGSAAVFTCSTEAAKQPAVITAKSAAAEPVESFEALPQVA